MSRARSLLVAIAAVAIGWTFETRGHGWDQPAWIPILDLAIGWVLVGAGLIGTMARPTQTAGGRLVLAGFLWFVGDLRQDGVLVVGDLAFALQGLYDLVLALVALSFPARWPARGADRAILVGLAAVFGAQAIVRLIANSADVFGSDLVEREVAFGLVAWVDVVRSTLFVVAGGLMIGRWPGSSGSMRRLLLPVMVAFVAVAAAEGYRAWYALAQLDLAPGLSNDIAVPVAWGFNLMRILVPAGFLLGILRLRAARSAVAQAIAEAGDRPSSLALRDALAGALRDPSLRILNWDEDAAAWRDEGGVIVPLPASTPELTVTPVDADGRRLAALVHDRALGEDPGLVAAGVAVTRLVIDNERLGREIGRQLQEVRASRARIVEAGDAERRRIERDLHDGVQQRLVAMAMMLRRASGRTDGGSEAGQALRQGADEALAVVEDVRELARGIHPAVLTEAGLGPALQALADRSPIPVESEVDLGDVVDDTAAATAYFVASEALANSAKHARASTIRLSATTADGRLTIRVDDDGIGGADSMGSGLRGLADRVAASGGMFRVDSVSGGGTRVLAVVPLD
jgi:signal transduction histidine kinase